MGGVLGKLRIIVEYNKDAKTEEDIRFKITRIEGGDNSGAGNRDGINLDYKNCDETRIELINKLFGGMIKPTGATNSTEVQTKSNTVKITESLVNTVAGIVKDPKLQKSVLEFMSKLKIDNNTANIIKKFIKDVLGITISKEEEENINNVINSQDFKIGDVIISYDNKEPNNPKSNYVLRIGKIEKVMASNYFYFVGIDGVGYYIKEDLTKEISNHKKLHVNTDLTNEDLEKIQTQFNRINSETERLYLGVITDIALDIMTKKNNLDLDNFDISKVHSIDKKFLKDAEPNETIISTTPISNGPMSKDFKESFMLAMALSSSVGSSGSSGVASAVVAPITGVLPSASTAATSTAATSTAASGSSGVASAVAPVIGFYGVLPSASTATSTAATSQTTDISLPLAIALSSSLVVLYPNISEKILKNSISIMSQFIEYNIDQKNFKIKGGANETFDELLKQYKTIYPTTLFSDIYAFNQYINEKLFVEYFIKLNIDRIKKEIVIGDYTDTYMKKDIINIPSIDKINIKLLLFKRICLIIPDILISIENRYETEKDKIDKFLNIIKEKTDYSKNIESNINLFQNFYKKILENNNEYSRNFKKMISVSPNINVNQYVIADEQQYGFLKTIQSGIINKVIEQKKRFEKNLSSLKNILKNEIVNKSKIFKYENDIVTLLYNKKDIDNKINGYIKNIDNNITDYSKKINNNYIKTINSNLVEIHNIIKNLCFNITDNKLKFEKNITSKNYSFKNTTNDTSIIYNIIPITDIINKFETIDIHKGFLIDETLFTDFKNNKIDKLKDIDGNINPVKKLFYETLNELSNNNKINTTTLYTSPKVGDIVIWYEYCDLIPYLSTLRIGKVKKIENNIVTEVSINSRWSKVVFDNCPFMRKINISNSYNIFEKIREQFYRIKYGLLEKDGKRYIITSEKFIEFIEKNYNNGFDINKYLYISSYLSPTLPH